MDVSITPRALSGSVRAVTSKSAAHRLLILAALADAPTRVAVTDRSEDIDATVSCLRAMGAGIEDTPDGFRVCPVSARGGSPLLDCGESGSTLRFLLPVAAAALGKARFTGRGRLPDRPLDDLIDVMEKHGVAFSSRRLPFEISGHLTGGAFRLPGNVSSQYITGLLMALSALGADSSVALTTRLESSSYVDITLSAMRSFCVDVDASDGRYVISGRDRLRSPGAVTAEGDWSNAAFFFSAGAVCGDVTVTGLDPDSAQGDRRIAELLGRFGAKVRVNGAQVRVERAALRGCRIDVSDVPDLLPVLSVVAACAEGETVFCGGQRLRLKESDRLRASAAMINNLGGDAVETPDGLIIRGGGLRGGTVDGFGDHRIVMSAAVAAAVCSDAVIITGAEAVNKSYPGFFEDYKHMGGCFDVI